MRILIIIVTYNGMKWLPKCLHAAHNQSLSADIFIVDNNSTDGTPAYIKETFSDVILVESKLNLGFGKANNIGIRYGIKKGYDYLFLLNQDAYLQADTLSNLIEIHQVNPSFGILSPMQYNGNGSDLDYKFMQVFESRSNCRLYKAAIIPQGKTSKLYSANFVMAALWLVSIDCARKVGEFDEIFDHYGEDNDYLNRTWFHKFKVGIVDECVGYHDRESREISDIKRLKISFSCYLAMLTNPNIKIGLVCWQVLRIIERRFRFVILKGRFSMAKVTARNTVVLFAKMQAILKCRRLNKAVYTAVKVNKEHHAMEPELN